MERNDRRQTRRQESKALHEQYGLFFVVTRLKIPRGYFYTFLDGEKYYSCFQTTTCGCYP
jgi:hypothetical protein